MKKLLLIVMGLLVLVTVVVSVSREHADGRIELFNKKFNWAFLTTIAKASYSIIPKEQNTLAVARTFGDEALNTAEDVFTGLFGLNGLVDRLWRAGGVGQVVVLIVVGVVVLSIIQQFNAVSRLKSTATGLLAPVGWGPVPLSFMAGSVLWLVNTISNLGGASSMQTFLAGDPNFQTSHVAGALLPMGLWMIVWGVVSYAIPAALKPDQLGNWVLKHVFIQIPLILVAIGFLFGDMLSALPDLWSPIKAIFTASSSVALASAGNKTTLFSVSLPILVLVAAWTFRRSGFIVAPKKK